MTERSGRAAAEQAPDDHSVSRPAYAVMAAGFVAFAIWGSLFPFAFEPIPWALARHTFWAAWGGGPLTWSISDFASNVLLFVPIGLFAVAAMPAAGPGPPRRAWALAVVLFAATLSVALELGQAFVPWRTASIVDVLAEAGGTVLGICVYAMAWRRCDRGIAAGAALFRSAGPFERALLLYCAAFAIGWLLPLDVTLRPREIADKYFHQRLLAPFTPSPDAASAAQLAAVLFAAMPLGVAAVRCAARNRHPWPVGWALGVAISAVCALEAMQILVFSRTTDATVLLPASGGILVGALLAGR